jgi:hypothetical protein
MDTIQKNDFKNDQQNQRGHLNPWMNSKKIKINIWVK